jgi:hypothetical protein
MLYGRRAVLFSAHGAAALISARRNPQWSLNVFVSTRRLLHNVLHGRWRLPAVDGKRHNQSYGGVGCAALVSLLTGVCDVVASGSWRL